MIKLTRISTAYPKAAKNINKKILKKKNLNYNELLKEVFLLGFGESNNITKELSKKNYDCNEIISNIKYLQKTWSKEYLQKKSNKNIILEQIFFYKPNVIYFGNYSLLTKDLLKEIRKLNHVKLIIVFHCSPITSEIEKKLKLADLVITCTDGYKEEIEKKIKKKTFLIHHAFNTSSKKYIKTKKRSIDVTFVGSLYMKSGLHINRINLIYILLKKFSNTYIGVDFPLKNFYYIFTFLFSPNSHYKLFGKLKLIYKIFYILINCRKAVYGNDMLELLNKSKLLINSHIEDTRYAGNMRLFEGTGMGCLVLTDNKIGLDKLFKINKQIVVYKNLVDLTNKIVFYLKNKKKLLLVAKNGYKKTHSKHNYKNRVKILDKLIKKNIKSYEKNLF